ncbi:MAG: Gfo/Idh/MocA family oxidoreductase [Rhodospirillales bacterium]|nr:Gfo/Idh/MocA family oxidoreductase [Rhodospirillales bacterium]
MSVPAPRIRLGMIGGGEDAFIGAVHRIAARLDDRYEFVAGALSSSAEKSIRSGLALGLPRERSYPDYPAMIAGEAKRADGVEAVAIVTPNHVHVPAAQACLAAGLHVICDKPLAVSLAEARGLAAAAAGSGRIFAVTYNYTGYPMVRHARAMVAAGEIGRVRVVQVEYAQDWLSTRLEESGQKQAAWRTDPARSGPAGALGDIGTHAFNLAEFVSGERVVSVACDLQATVPGRQLDDNAQMLLRFRRGARGGLWASQVAVGRENGLCLRVYGETAGLEWRQEEPNSLRVSRLGEAPRVVTRASAAARPEAARVTRLPGGHPEGYLEAFATIYSEVARAIVAHKAGAALPSDVSFPDIGEGMRGMAFIEAAIRSGRSDARWTEIES